MLHTYLLKKHNYYWSGRYGSSKKEDGNNNQTIFQNCAPCTSCITEINNTQIDNTKDLDISIPMNKLI